MLEGLKQEVLEANCELPRARLVTSTSGNVSGRDRESDLVVIKPSAVKYEHLTIDDMVVVNLDGTVVEGLRKPSTDTLSHLYVYKHRPDVMGIVHTHSNYATSFAALGKPIPVCLTTIADEFGGDVPVAPYASVGDEEIGEYITRFAGVSPVVLLQQHGVFTIGTSVEKALKAAIMVEDAAKTVHLAMQKGVPERLSTDVVRERHEYYLNSYGQR